MKMNPNEYAALLRTDPYAFIQRAFYQLHPNAAFLPNWHLEVMLAELEECRRGRNRRLIFTMPPRNLKSFVVSIGYLAFWFGHNPSLKVICSSYGQALADKHALDYRDILTSDWYQTVFPTRLTSARASLSELTTTQQGFRMATSVEGVLTGRGADVLIVDDILKPDEAVSDTQRKKPNEWFSRALFSRLDNKQTGVIIIVQQRLHEDDLVGHVLAQQEKWKLVRFPAIAEKDEKFVIGSFFGDRKVFRRRTGEALHPEREPLEVLENIRRTIGEYNFAGQYQQAPAPTEGGIIKREWFRLHGPEDWPQKFEKIIQSWDTASKASELSDFSACTTWGVKDKHYYLLHVLRKRLNYPELKRAVRTQAQEHRPQIVLIEDTSSGTQLIQELVAEGFPGITKYVPNGDKIMRMHAQTATIENGFVHLPKDAHWLEDYLHELSVFNRGKYDDQVDSTSQALDWLKRQGGGGEAIIEYFRKIGPGPRWPTEGVEAKVRMLAPPGTEGQNHYVAKGGFTIPKDRIVEVTEEQARLLPGNRKGWTRLS